MTIKSLEFKIVLDIGGMFTIELTNIWSQPGLVSVIDVIASLTLLQLVVLPLEGQVG